MENEKGLYVALGVYIGELQKRADLKNDEICKSVHIGHSTFNDLKKGQKTDKVKVAGGKKFPACGLYEWIFL